MPNNKEKNESGMISKFCPLSMLGENPSLCLQESCHFFMDKTHCCLLNWSLWEIGRAAFLYRALNRKK